MELTFRHAPQMLIFFVLLVEWARFFLHLTEVAYSPHGRSNSSFDRSVRIQCIYEWKTMNDLLAFHLINFRVPIKEDFWPVELFANGNYNCRFFGLNWMVGNQKLLRRITLLLFPFRCGLNWSPLCNLLFTFLFFGRAVLLFFFWRLFNRDSGLFTFFGHFLNIFRQIDSAELPIERFHHKSTAVSRSMESLIFLNWIKSFTGGLLRRFHKNRFRCAQFWDLLWSLVSFIVVEIVEEWFAEVMITLNTNLLFILISYPNKVLAFFI